PRTTSRLIQVRSSSRRQSSARAQHCADSSPVQKARQVRYSNAPAIFLSPSPVPLRRRKRRWPASPSPRRPKRLLSPLPLPKNPFNTRFPLISALTEHGPKSKSDRIPPRRQQGLAVQVVCQRQGLHQQASRGPDHSRLPQE